jgi:hypothetical protein
MVDTYILDGRGRVIACPDIHTWAVWFTRHSRRVALDKIGRNEVCTVFLGVDQSAGHRLVFETKVFGSKYVRVRYAHLSSGS